MFHESVSSEIVRLRNHWRFRTPKKCSTEKCAPVPCMIRVKVRQESAPLASEKVRQDFDARPKSAPLEKSAPDFFRDKTAGNKSARKKCATPACERLVRRGTCRVCTRRRWADAHPLHNREKLRRRRARKPRSWPCLDCGKPGLSMRCRPCAARRTAYLHLASFPRKRKTPKACAGKRDGKHCGRPVHAKGRCSSCYARRRRFIARRTLGPCRACEERPAVRKDAGLCARCYARRWRKRNPKRLIAYRETKRRVEKSRTCVDCGALCYRTRCLECSGRLQSELLTGSRMFLRKRRPFRA